MRRREFIAGIAGVSALPLAARSQEREQVRRIGVLLPATADDLDMQARLAAFHQGLALLGWTIGRNVRIAPAGPRPMPPRFAGTPRNWWISRHVAFTLAIQS